MKIILFYFIFNSYLNLGYCQNIINGDTIHSYLFLDEPPHFKGGRPAYERFLAKNFNYEQIDGECSGYCIISFIVRRDGSLTNIKIEKPLHPFYDKEFKRVVELMPKWVPGKLKKVNVDSKVYLEMDFTIRGNY